MFYDSIVIGKGPAGIEAAIYIKRANRNVLIIGKDGGSLEKTEKIENFYGQENMISGKELLEKGIKQARNLGIDVIKDEVVGIDFLDCNYKVKTVKNEYEAKTVVIATGANRKAPLIDGMKEFEGKGVSYCAICDGFFYKDKDVAVIGEGDYAISEVEALLPIANNITILTNGKEEVLKRNENVKCNTQEISAIRGNTQVEKVVFKDKTELEVSGVFVAEGAASSLDFARKIGAEITENRIVVDHNNMETTVPGLFAAGDCTGELYQITKAVYEGMKAGLGVINYLSKN